MIWRLIRFFLFLIPAETTHELSKHAMRLMAHFLPMPKEVKNNPIGLAAGFDKNCEILDLLPKFGFGHAEIGTVTPRPQGGNDRPRLFRNPKAKTLFNRMGFNNLGAGVISERLRRIKPKLPNGFIVGVNLGKNKLTPDAEAAQDYAKVAASFAELADYMVINVSSPNTPGLRALQTIDALTTIVKAVRGVLQKTARKVPLYVKLAPEMGGEELKSLLKGLIDLGIDGFVLTNTQAGVYIYRGKELSGGWSGQNLSSIAADRLSETKSFILSDLNPSHKVDLVSVGGIMTAQEARRRVALGATLIQIYTGWIYQGPFFAKRILRELRRG